MNNNRYQCLRYSIGCNSVLHGFAGYFEATLYDDVMLSKSFVAAAAFVAQCLFNDCRNVRLALFMNFWITTLSVFCYSQHKLAWLSGEDN